MNTEKKSSLLAYILAVNACWDFACAFSILTKLSPLSTVHTNLWKDSEDRDSEVTSHLMAYLIFCWGSMRLAGAAWGMTELAVFSYVIEGALFACETMFFGTLHYEPGMTVSFVSFWCAFYCKTI